MQTIKIDLNERSYQIYLGNSITNNLDKVISTFNLPKNIVIITDRIVERLYLKQLIQILRNSNFRVTSISIPHGEKEKSLRRANKIYTELLKQRIQRNATVIAFGGGVVGDMAGFVSATYKRGLTLIQIPTTLLAQVESSIGGKTSVNHPLSKNAIGAYKQPIFVFSDTRFLSTLSKREIICGMGEILKYAYLDEQIFQYIDTNFEKIMYLDLNIVEEIIRRCVTLKSKLISEDETELDTNGGRAILNLGHTIGQPLETLSNYKLHHGEAVLIGLKLELEIAYQSSIVGDETYQRLKLLLDRIDFRPKLHFLKPSMITKKIFGHEDKVKFVLPKQVGVIQITKEIPRKLVETILHKII